MSFDSPLYLVFLSAVALLYRLCPTRGRPALLLTASLFFYGSWNAPLTLLLAVIVVAYLAGLGIERAKDPKDKRRALALALAACVGLLGYFKYFHFLAESLEGLLRLGGADARFRLWDIVLPVGVSFYTFQAMSYTIDVYRGAPAERHFGYFALYIAFFPQLVAGPIERAEALLPQLRDARTPDGDDLRSGLRTLLNGFFRKIVIADGCARFVEAVYDAPAPDGSAVLLATLLFGVQIYCDFSGYSEIARGSARLLGIRLTRNFDRPYLAQSLRDFWRCWHISLSRWFTDYLYIPLGGNRKGRARQALATLAVFAVSGLWHGANWTFAVWGLFHGALMVLETLVHPRKSRLTGILTFAAVMLSWIFFRAQSLAQAFALLGRLFAPWDIPTGLALTGLTLTDALWLPLALLQLPPLHRLSSDDAPPPGDLTRVYLFLAIAAAWLVRLGQGGANAFIYFQF